MENNTIKTETRFHSDKVSKYLLMGIAFIAVSIVFFIILFIFGNSIDAIKNIGIVELLTGTSWRPGREEYGTVPLITGTLLVTIGAILFAVPVGVGSAIFISEVAPKRWRATLKSVSEVFAGIPSVIYGFFGLTFLVPLLRDLFPEQLLFGFSWLAGSIILGIMALPTIISVSEDALNSVPKSYREASLAIGATKWETTVKVVTPAAISGISAAIILGMGRAIGETMAVMMVCGNAALMPNPIFDVFSMILPITATIAVEMPYIGVGSTHYSALFFLALILMVMVFFISMASNAIVKRTKRKFGEVVEKETLAGKLMSKIPVDVLNASKNILAILGLFVMSFLISNIFLNHVAAAVMGVLVTAAIVMVSLLWLNDLTKENKAARPRNPSEFIEVVPAGFKGYLKTSAVYVIIFALFYMAAYLLIGNIEAILVGLAAVGAYVGLRAASKFIDSRKTQMIAHSSLFIVMLFAISMLAVILLDIFRDGLPMITWDFLTGYPTNGGRAGGILPAIVGTLKLIIGAMVVALPLGVITGIYLAEYSKDNSFTRLVRYCIDILNGTPSIVFGLFAMAAFVIYLGFGYSLIAGCLALGFMVLPVIIRSTEEALRAVPNELREGSMAMGATRWETTVRVVLPAAIGSIITGTILSIGRTAGETAPIMFTAVIAYQSSMSHSIMDPVMALPYQLFYLATEGGGSPEMQSAIASVLLIIVLLIFVTASLVRNYYIKKIKW